MLRRVLISFVVGLLLVAGTAAAGLFWLQFRFTAPGPATAAQTLVLPRGAGVLAIARELQAHGVISDARAFAIAVRLRRQQRDLQAGEYSFAAHASMRQVLEQLRAGRTVVRRLTVPEGLTVAEVTAVLLAAPGLTGELDAVLPEGGLLPETYHYSYGDSRTELVARMRQAMADTLAELWQQRQADLPLASQAEAVILASIVEKETALARERPHIAGVFVNRLRRGMRLQSDPTVVYALTAGQGALQRPLTRADLTVDSPYNTYRNAGLPPGPIVNPGRAALAAVLQPLDTEDLYFVADGSGGHAFARSYKEHQRNVRRWRQVQRSRPKAAD